jgi:hypothetical protein
MMFRFAYKYRGLSGDLLATSVAQAADRIAVRYLATLKIKPTDGFAFKKAKSQLTRPWQIKLSPSECAAMKRVWRSLKDGDGSQHDKEYWQAVKTVLRDLQLVKEP